MSQRQAASFTEQGEQQRQRHRDRLGQRWSVVEGEESAGGLKKSSACA